MWAVKNKHLCAHVLNSKMLVDYINIKIVITYLKYFKQPELGKKHLKYQNEKQIMHHMADFFSSSGINNSNADKLQ